MSRQAVGNIFILVGTILLIVSPMQRPSLGEEGGLLVLMVAGMLCAITGRLLLNAPLLELISLFLLLIAYMTFIYTAYAPVYLSFFAVSIGLWLLQSYHARRHKSVTKKEMP